MTLPAFPRRIVSLLPADTEILFAVGAGDQVVGVTEFCDWPPEARSRDKVGGIAGKSISLERLLVLQPDLVLTGGDFHREVIEALEKRGIPVFAVDPRSFRQIGEALETVGRLTGHAAEARRRVAAMRAQQQRVAALAAGVPAAERPRVFWEVWDNPLMTVGAGVFLSEAIRLAGGIVLFDDLQADYPVVSAEEVVARDPQVILSTRDHAEALTPPRLAARPGWSGVQAVRDGRIHLLDSDIVSRPGPRAVNALGLIARALWPEAFRREFGDADPALW